MDILSIILAVDPGTQKCGLAVVSLQGEVFKKAIVLSVDLVGTVEGLLKEFPVSLIVVGDRTKSKAIRENLKLFGLPIELVDENESSLEGRYRYLRENTRGLARLLPIGLRIPKKPFDDYVAVILAERYLARNLKRSNSQVGD